MQIDNKESIVTIKMDCPLVAANTEKLLEQAKGIFDKPDAFKSVIIDLTHVEAIDSLGINMLVGLYKECQKHQKTFKVVGASQALKRLFEIFKLTSYFGIE